MEGIELLLHRSSSPVLESPGPTGAQMEIMFQAALRAPDHARLRPWRFLTVEGDARERLGELLAKAALSDQSDLSEDALARFRGMPLRAPTLVLCVCVVKERPKVPEVEQKMSLAAAVQSLLLAAYDQGIGAIWRTGDLCYHPVVAEGLGLADNEHLMGFVYLGKPSGSQKKLPEMNVSDYVTEWQG